MPPTLCATRKTATTVRLIDDTPMKTDGPFADDRVAQRCPSAATGCVEVRQIMDTS